MSLGDAYIDIHANTAPAEADIARLKAIVEASGLTVPLGTSGSSGGGSSSSPTSDADSIIKSIQAAQRASAAASAAQASALGTQGRNENLLNQIEDFNNLGSAATKATEDVAKGAKGAEDATQGLGDALQDVLTKTRNFGSFIENIVNVFKALPFPGQLALLVVAAGAVEAAFVGAITAVSAAADAALVKVGLTAAGSIEDVRNQLTAAFGVPIGTEISAQLLQISTASGIAEAALGGVVVQLQGLGLNAPEATAVLSDFVTAIDAAGLHGKAATTALSGLESAFGQAATASKFTTATLRSFSDILPNIDKNDFIKQLAANLKISADQAERLLAAGKVTTTQGLTAVQQVAANAPQTATPSVGGIVDTTKNAIENALGEAFDSPAVLGKIQALATTIQKLLSNPQFTAELTKGFQDFASFAQNVLPRAFDLFEKGTAEADLLIKRFGPDIAGLVSDISAAFTAITTRGTAANDVLRSFEGVIEIVVAAFKTAEPIIDEVGTALGAVGASISLVGDLLTGNFAGALHDVEDILKDVGNVALDIFQQIGDIILETIKVSIEALVKLADAANHIPFVNIDTSGLKSAETDINNLKSNLDSIPDFTTKQVNVNIDINTIATSGDALNTALGGSNNNGGLAIDASGGLSPDDQAALAAASAARAATSAASAATSGGGGGSSAASKAAQAAKTLAAATTAFHASLSTFNQAIGGAQTVAAVDAAFASLQSAIDTEDKALGKKEPTGLVTYLAKQKAALDKSASELQLALSERASFLATADVSVPNSTRAGAAGIIQGLTSDLQRATEFAADIKKLQAEGLNQTAIQQFLAAGPTEASIRAANDIIQAGQTSISTINGLQTQIGAQGESLGTVLASNFQTVGQQAAQGLIDGLKSAEPALEAQMKALATAMDAQIKKDLKIKSPSEVFAMHGENVVAGLALGISRSATPSVAIPTLGRGGSAGGLGGVDNSITFGPGSIIVQTSPEKAQETGTAVGGAIRDVLLARRIGAALGN